MLIHLEIINKNSEDDKDKVYELILHGIKARLNEWILIWTFGAKRTDDEATRGYYLVK